MATYTFSDGEVLTATLLNTYCAGEGGAWTSWTPTVTQSGSVTVTNTRSRYARYGRTIHWSIELNVTGSGSAANIISITLPVTAASATSTAGSGVLVDLSAALKFGFIAEFQSTTAFVMQCTDSSAAGRLGETGAPFAGGLASGDVIRASGTYEAAS